MPTGGIISSLFTAAGGGASAITAAGVGTELAATASAAATGLSIASALNKPKQPAAPTVKAPVALPNPAAVQQQETTLAAQAVNQSGRQSTLLTSPLGTTGATTLGG